MTLTTKYSFKLPTSEEIKKMIQNASPLEIERVWIKWIMHNQTQEEKFAEDTREHNNVGLTAYDGRPISYYYTLITSGERSHSGEIRVFLDPEQVENARQKLQKYHAQYRKLMTEQQANYFVTGRISSP